jgi:hypothetical protein
MRTVFTLFSRVVFLLGVPGTADTECPEEVAFIAELAR